MTLQEILEGCAQTTRAKGFRTDQHATQVALIATEVAEALEHVLTPMPYETRLFVASLAHCCARFELFRKQARGYSDFSVPRNAEALLGELADIQIRLASYLGGNGWGERFEQILAAKMVENAERPHKHGKGF